MAQLLKEGEIQHIHYKKDVGPTSSRKRLPYQLVDRYIIPVSVPGQNVKAIDVSELSTAQREDMKTLVQEYAEYVEVANKKVFSFEEWVDHTSGREVSPKWRTFNLSRFVKRP